MEIQSRYRFGKSFWFRSARRGLLIALGAVIQGFAMGVFLFPHSIPTGGGAGLALLMHYWFQSPISIGLWAANFFF